MRLGEQSSLQIPDSVSLREPSSSVHAMERWKRTVDGADSDDEDGTVQKRQRTDRFVAGPARSRPAPPLPPPPRKLAASEIFAGSGVLSRELRRRGVSTLTCDSDPVCEADDTSDVLDLADAYCADDDIVFFAPECRTWSNLSGGLHRTRERIEGFTDAARRANRELEKCITIMEHTNRANTRAIFCLENPAALMRHHPLVKERLERGLGLTRLTLCMCKFATVDNLHRQKPTDLWTNSKSIINLFKDGSFMCKKAGPTCEVGYGRHNHTRPEPGSGDRARNAARYPDDLAALLARLLILDARRDDARRSGSAARRSRVLPPAPPLRPVPADWHSSGSLDVQAILRYRERLYGHHVAVPGGFWPDADDDWKDLLFKCKIRGFTCNFTFTGAGASLRNGLGEGVAFQIFDVKYRHQYACAATDLVAFMATHGIDPSDALFA